MLGVGCLVSCVTKKKTVEVQKSEISAESKEISESSSVQNIATQSQFKRFSSTDYLEAMKQWNVGYDGSRGDSFRFWMKETEDGFEAGAEGAGTANASGSEQQVLQELREEWRVKFDSVSQSYEEKFAELEFRLTQKKRDKSVEKWSAGLQAGAYIAGTILLIVLILLLWLGRKLRRLEKYAQPLNDALKSLNDRLNGV